MSSRESTLWCGNLSPKVDEELLFELFLQAGPVEKVVIPKEKNGCNKGYGFVMFKHEVSVVYAIALLKGVKLFGQMILPQQRTATYFDQRLNHQRRFSLQDYRNGPCLNPETWARDPNKAACGYAFQGYNIPVLGTHVQQTYVGTSGMQAASASPVYNDQMRFPTEMVAPIYHDPMRLQAAMQRDQMRFHGGFGVPTCPGQMHQHSRKNHMRRRTHHGAPLNYENCSNGRKDFSSFSTVANSPSILLCGSGENKPKPGGEHHQSSRNNDNQKMSLGKCFQTIYDRRRKSRK